MDHDYICGKCMEMCPKQEIKLREQQKLLHILEVVSGTENNRIPKADKSRMVKAFSRSAAGKETQDSENLRPPKILLKTVNYILEDVISRTDVPWSVIYDFVMDRFRSVRQDMIIQNISSTYFISILQPIIRFHIYASYRLCEESIKNFDPHINSMHLQECLKRLLYTFDQFDELDDSEDYLDTTNEFLLENRPNFEAIYLILNLGNPIAITRALNLSRKWRTELVERALELSLCFTTNNYIRVFRNIKMLPTLLLMVASFHLQELRRATLKVMSVAYNSKNLTYNLKHLKQLLLYDGDDQLITDCKYYGLEMRDNGICFIKNSFDSSKVTITPKHQKFVDEKLVNTDISTLILFGD